MALRRTLVPLAALVLVATGCGDDDGGDAATSTTAVTSVDAGPGDGGSGDPADQDPTTTTTSSTIPDVEAEDPPAGSGGDAEGAADDFVYVADLTGEDGVSGRAELRAGDAGELCADIEVSGLASEATGAHVHESQDGAVVVDLGEPTAVEGDTATWDGVCVPVDDSVTRALAVDATRFHADVHTQDHPDRAASGQLAFATIFDLELS